MKYVVIALTTLMLAGCTPEMRESWRKERAMMNSYNSYGLVEFTGANEVFKGRQERTDNELRTTCVEDGENRVVSFSGSSDDISYRQCKYTPYPANLDWSRIQRKP